MWQEFKEFAFKKNVIELAVALILGLAFTAVVNSLVKDIIMPPIGLLLGGVNFSDLYINLSSTQYASLADAEAAGAPTINYGNFINTVLSFLVIAFALFLVVRLINRTTLASRPAETKDCPYCLSTIPLGATRCPECTSDLPAPSTEPSAIPAS